MIWFLGEQLVISGGKHRRNTHTLLHAHTETRSNVSRWDPWCVICHSPLPHQWTKGPRDDVCHPLQNISLRRFLSLSCRLSLSFRQPAIISACSEKSVHTAWRTLKAIKSFWTDLSGTKWRSRPRTVTLTLMAAEQAPEKPFNKHHQVPVC